MLNHINHKMPIYKDCTLFELMVVVTLYLGILGITLSLLAWVLFGYAMIGLSITILSMLHGTRFLLSRLQKMKYGKPYGYYQQWFLKRMVNFPLAKLFWQSPWIQREGRWSVRRMRHEG